MFSNMPLKDKLGFLFAVIIIGSIVGCGMCCRSDHRFDISDDDDDEVRLEVRADKLINDYVENQLSADDKYKNRMIEVRGKVGRVKKERGKVVVEIYDSQNSVWALECSLRSDYEKEAIDLREGDWVTIAGKCKGLKGYSVEMTRCYLK